MMLLGGQYGLLARRYALWEQPRPRKFQQTEALHAGVGVGGEGREVHQGSGQNSSLLVLPRPISFS